MLIGSVWCRSPNRARAPSPRSNMMTFTDTDNDLSLPLKYRVWFLAHGSSARNTGPDSDHDVRKIDIEDTGRGIDRHSTNTHTHRKGEYKVLPKTARSRAEHVELQGHLGCEKRCSST